MRSFLFFNKSNSTEPNKPTASSLTGNKKSILSEIIFENFLFENRSAKKTEPERKINNIKII